MNSELAVNQRIYYTLQFQFRNDTNHILIPIYFTTLVSLISQLPFQARCEGDFEAHVGLPPSHIITPIPFALQLTDNWLVKVSIIFDSDSFPRVRRNQQKPFTRTQSPLARVCEVVWQVCVHVCV